MRKTGGTAIPNLPSSGFSGVLVMVKKFLTFKIASSTISDVSLMVESFLASR